MFLEKEIMRSTKHDVIEVKDLGSSSEWGGEAPGGRMDWTQHKSNVTHIYSLYMRLLSFLQKRRSHQPLLEKEDPSNPQRGKGQVQG